MPDSVTIKSYDGHYDLLALQAAQPDYYPYFLESSARLAHSREPAYDILFACPQQRLIKNQNQQVKLENRVLSSDSFIDELDRIWQAQYQPGTNHALPFLGGWFVYLGYELVQEIEPRLGLSDFDTPMPVAMARRIPAAVIYHHQQNKTYIIAEQQAAGDFPRLERDLLSAGLYSTQTQTSAVPGSPVLPEISEEDPLIYQQAIDKVLQYIREGDVFQVNLSRRWLGQYKSTVDAIAIYRQLRRSNPAPFSALIYHEGNWIISSSPERLVRVQGERIETRPIAGTRPRSSDHQQDSRLRHELLDNMKERAEHIMLIDLERNDLGRLCQPGTIEVDELMVTESYAHVHHIVSNVRGKLASDITPGRIIRAVFPGGTITGCPKVRCMEIIHELEHTPRGAYTGSLGYLNHNGDLDLNILIRTFTAYEQCIEFRAGAGIVADSLANRELQETRAKAKGLLAAITEPES